MIKIFVFKDYAEAIYLRIRSATKSAAEHCKTLMDHCENGLATVFRAGIYATMRSRSI